MWEHGFATQFLAEAVLHMRREGKDVSAIMPKLRAAAALIRQAQNIEGGWGYRPLPDPHAEVGPAAAQLDALLRGQTGRSRSGPARDQSRASQPGGFAVAAGSGTFQGEWRSFSYEAKAFVLESLLGLEGPARHSILSGGHLQGVAGRLLPEIHRADAHAGRLLVQRKSYAGAVLYGVGLPPARQAAP